jgi:5,5'-dehydrodivanillate O-demethylase
MLTQEQNEKISRVGPGTPGGNLLRHYWFPIAGSAELSKLKPTKRVRLLGEDLVLYRDLSGKLGLIEEPCAHRRVSMYYGIPEADGLRCPYHGWLYDHEGRCVEQPAEPEGSTFKDRIRMNSYSVEELGGLVFAYLGPDPVPCLPHYDLFAWPNTIRQVGMTVLPCNWVQCMENSLDATHVEWLHGHYTNFVNEQAAEGEGREFRRRIVRKHVRIGFDLFEHGILKRRIEEGGSEEDDDWRIGHPVVFPHMLKTGAMAGPSFQIRVPMDDDHTLHILYKCYRPGIDFPPQEEVPVHDLPWVADNGDADVSFTLGQDMMAWVTQGGIAARELEKLGASDTGIIMFRNLLLEQIERVERGEEPMEVYHDPEQAKLIELPQETTKHGQANWGRPGSQRDGLSRHMPTPSIVGELFQKAEELEAAGHQLQRRFDPTLDRAAERREVVIKR